MFSRGAFLTCALTLEVLAILGGPIQHAFARDYWSMSCSDLWLSRNAIFARNGYCFKTERAIGVFGNDGCRFYLDRAVPMSPVEREEVEFLRSIEQHKGCQR
jgi:hypothetical protein